MLFGPSEMSIPMWLHAARQKQLARTDRGAPHAPTAVHDAAEILQRGTALSKHVPLSVELLAPLPQELLEISCVVVGQALAAVHHVRHRHQAIVAAAPVLRVEDAPPQRVARRRADGDAGDDEARRDGQNVAGHHDSAESA